MSAHADSASDLARVRSLFEQFRARRSAPNQRIPEDLWLAAISLLDRFPLQLVAKELHVSDSRLRHQRDALAPASSPEPPSAHFLRLPVPPSAAGSAPHADAVARLVLERPDGSRLSLSVPASDSDRLDALCRAFLSS